MALESTCKISKLYYMCLGEDKNNEFPALNLAAEMVEYLKSKEPLIKEKTKCEGCDKMILMDSRVFPYCTVKCKIHHLQESRECVRCFKPFIPPTPASIYCSKTCSEMTGKEAYEKLRKITHYRIFNRDGFSCIYCGSSPIKNSEVVLVVDHVYPMAKGGKNDLFNLATCCSICNGNKSDIMLSEEKISEIWRRNKEKNDSIPEIVKNYDEMVSILDKVYFSRLKII